ncbi:helix-turn-helix domain-containing protein [Mycoplasmopsis opalescens]|uniref:helix-turn-helix domain-containing protein n=1 Tax=Mycoplasmopsis opalescens TaxID=114886 RepID=UPI00069168DF|nr:DnaA/Hda family protein [Mycoplasmopsis opalescens]
MKANANTSSNAALNGNMLTFHTCLKSYGLVSFDYKTFLEDLIIKDIDASNHIILSTPKSSDIAQIIKAHYGQFIEKALEETFEKKCTFSIESTLSELGEIQTTLNEDKNNKKHSKTDKKSQNEIEDTNSIINTSYTLENYVEGEFNTEAIRLANYIINGGREFNLIFIYGNSGTGKTHLLHSICNGLEQKNITTKYVNPISFTTNMSSLLQENNTKRIKAVYDEYCKVDVILFDDIQSYATGSKKSTLQMLYNILDNRMMNNKITFFASDKPLEILHQYYEPRIVTRLSSSLIIEIKQPNQKDMIRILDFLIEKRNLHLEAWEDEAKKAVIISSQASIRAMVGIINKLSFYNTELEKRANSKYTAAVVKNILARMNKTLNQITPDSILEAVSKYYKVPKKEILGKSRRKEIIIARHIAMYIVREQLKMSFDHIGMFFGNRDHTTVINAFEKIRNEKEDPSKSIDKAIITISDNVFHNK